MILITSPFANQLSLITTSLEFIIKSSIAICKNSSYSTVKFRSQFNICSSSPKNSSKMGNFLSFVLLQLLFIGYSSQSPGNFQSTNQDLPKRLPQGIMKPIDFNETHFMDLCDDVLLQIFSDLNVEDFLKLSEAFPPLSHLINDAFRRKYGKCEFKMMSIDLIETNTISEFYENKKIEMYGVRIFKEILSYFGQFITRIGAKNLSIRESQSKIINQLIQKHCADTIKGLELDFIKENTFATFNVPLSNLEELSFIVNLPHVSNGALKLNQLFPKLRR